MRVPFVSLRNQAGEIFCGADLRKGLRLLAPGIAISVRRLLQIRA